MEQFPESTPSEKPTPLPDSQGKVFRKLHDFVRTGALEGIAEDLCGEEAPLKELDQTQRQTIVRALLDRVAAEKRDQFGKSRLLNALYDIDRAAFDEQDRTGKIAEATKAALDAQAAQWERTKRQSTGPELFAAYHGRVKELYRLLSYQHSVQGETLCNQEISSIASAIRQELHQKRAEFLEYLDSGFTKYKRQLQTDDLAKALTNYDKVAATEAAVRDIDWAGLKADLLSSIKAAMAVAEGSRLASAVTMQSDAGYCIFQWTSKAPVLDTQWRIEPALEDRVVIRCISGTAKGAVHSLDRQAVLNAVASGELDKLFQDAISRHEQDDRFLQDLQKVLKRDGDHYRYEARDGTSWRVRLLGIVVTIEAEADKRTRMEVLLSDFRGTDIESLVLQATANRKRQIEARKHLEAYDIPIEQLKKDGHKVAHINLFPKSDGRVPDDAIPSTLATGLFASAALAERYGATIDTRPVVFSDQPKEALRAEIQRAYQDGARFFCIDIFSHGTDSRLMFHEQLTAADLVGIAKDMCKEHPECRFQFGTAACFGGGLRYGFLREFQKTPELAKYVSVFLQTKPTEMNFSALTHSKHKEDEKSGGTLYLNAFLRATLRGQLTYGAAASAADLAVCDETEYGNDAEAIINGELISLLQERQATLLGDDVVIDGLPSTHETHHGSA